MNDAVIVCSSIMGDPSIGIISFCKICVSCVKDTEFCCRSTNSNVGKLHEGLVVTVGGQWLENAMNIKFINCCMLFKLIGKLTLEPNHAYLKWSL